MTLGSWLRQLQFDVTILYASMIILFISQAAIWIWIYVSGRKENKNKE